MAEAATFTLSSDDVSIASGNAGTPTGNVRDFDFVIEITDPLAAGSTVSDPTISTVDYEVSGPLDAGNPSGFPAFDLNRPEPGKTLTGAEFYLNGASLDFRISAGADLSDGVQVDELTMLGGFGYPAPVDATGAVFILDAREVGTGRYHPPVVILRADGTGQILNSNNTGDNPQDAYGVEQIEGTLIGLDYGKEYITDFTFDPSTLTILSGPFTAIPLPAGWLLLATALGLGAVLRRRDV